MHQLLLLIGLLFVCAPTLSEPPHPRPPAGANRQSTEDTNANQAFRVTQRGTSDAPLVVEGVITTKPNETEDKAANDYLALQTTIATAGFTGLMFLVALGQAFLFLKQLRYMKAALEDSKKSADAAKRSVEIAQDTADRQLRAYVYVLLMENVFLSLYAGRNVIDVRFKNFGSTPATIDIMSAYLLVGDEAKPLSSTNGGMVLGQGDEQLHRFEEHLTTTEMGSILANQKSLRCVCAVTYRDILDRTRETVTVWMYSTNPESMGFIPDPAHPINRRT